MKKTDVLIIGGSAAGMVVALTGKAHWPDKEFILVKKQKDVMVPCGIPYIFGILETSNKNVMAVDTMMANNHIETLVDEAIEIDHKAKSVKFLSGEKIEYDKLVIATGSIPVKPKWLQGADLDGVFVIPKDKTYLDEMHQKLKTRKRIAVIGAGFIGVELSDELNKSGFEVTLIEKLPHILNLAFDVELSGEIENMLTTRGVNVLTGMGITKVIGDDKVSQIQLEDGSLMDIDAVVLSMGYIPNTVLAKNSDIPIDEDGFILVDEYMRTDIKDVFAVGDCAQKHGFVTRRRLPTMLASTACAEARIAGMNLFNLHVVKTFSGTIAIYSTAIGNTGFGTAGVIEQRAREEGIEIISAMFTGINRHPGSIPDAHKQTVKLIAARYSGVIIGGEVIGGLEAGELTNVIGLAIQNRMTVNNLLGMQIGTHPCLTASPAAYPLIKAAEMISMKMTQAMHTKK
ncbi:MAG: FAD-dependent oxidoreductase [Bacteroidales bacterium]|nr:FAD-dependent oxidoreductase [Bacteroidales bacterium]